MGMQALNVTLLVALGCLVGWPPLLFSISRISGWATLARHYPVDEAFHLNLWRGQSMSFGPWMGYNQCVTMAAGPSGVFLRLPWVFAWGHRPLLLPWHAMRLEVSQGWMGRSWHLTLADHPRIDLRMTEAMFRRLAEIAPPESLVADHAN